MTIYKRYAATINYEVRLPAHTITKQDVRLVGLINHAS